MNQYAIDARTYWREYRPREAATMTDSEWTRMGEEINAEIVQVADQLAGPDNPAEGHLDKVARLNSARIRATEIVMQERVYSQPPEPEVEEMMKAEDRDLDMDAIYQSMQELSDALTAETDNTDSPNTE